MRITSKIQLSAAAVIANCLAVLGTMASGPAAAETCQDTLTCFFCPSNPTQYCQNAQPGCTVNNAICVNAWSVGCGGAGGATALICDYA